MGTLSAHEVAEYLLAQISEESGDTISNLKLQKLLYYSQGLYLAIHDKPLFTDQIRAWAHGPVVPSVYHAYKQCGASAIPKPQGLSFARISKSKRAFLDEIWNVFGQFEAWKLRNMTHKESPWTDAEPDGIIKREVMRQYFQRYIKR